MIQSSSIMQRLQTSAIVSTSDFNRQAEKKGEAFLNFLFLQMLVIILYLKFDAHASNFISL